MYIYGPGQPYYIYVCTVNIYGIFSRGHTMHAVVYGVYIFIYIWFWPTLDIPSKRSDLRCLCSILLLSPSFCYLHPPSICWRFLSKQAVKVNSLGKWKTACQMLSMSALLVVRQPQSELQFFLPAFMSGELHS